MSEFCHLHCHSEYSLLDGMSRIDDLVLKAKELNQPAIALTDHGVMFGAIEFYQAAKRHGIKPIMGLEAYMARRTMESRQADERRPFHMLLLAQNQTGYQNLLKLSSIGQLDGFYQKPRIDRDILAQHAEGLIATTGCLAAEVPRVLLKDGENAAYEKLKWYLDVFGRERFFLELQGHDIPDLRKVNNVLLDWSRKYEVGLIATNDVHYVNKNDADPHEVLLCMQTHDVLSNPKRLQITPHGSYYITSSQEMAIMFSHYPDALKNTIRIAEMCEVDLDPKGYHLPIYPVPEGDDAQSYLRDLVEKGLVERYGESRAKQEPVVRERIERELRIIHDMGFDTYFLIVWDLCQFAAREDIWWNVRGSGAGSVVAYTLRITNIDPIKNDLIFERFLNPDRVSMPDFDLDFPDDRRHRMIEYAVGKYGEDKCAAIITFGTLGAKAAVRDVGRTFGMTPTEVNRLAAMLPSSGKVKLKKVLFDESGLEEWPVEATSIRDAYQQDVQIKKVLDIAMKLEGQTRHASTHAAGIVISDKPIVEYAPLHRPTKGDDSGPIQQVVQFDMNIVESIGLLKVDFLGLATLAVMRRACTHIAERHGRDLNLNNIPYERNPDNPEYDANLMEAYKLLQRGETVGVFQVESDGLRRVLQDMLPDQFEHIIAAISLYRPGPLEYIPTYIKRMHGQEEVAYHHPLQKPILENTFGICVYQEQIMRMASDIAGYSPGEADLMRRAVSKKKEKDIEKHKQIFIEGASKNGVGRQAAEKIYGEIEYFARYGFNKCLPGDVEVIDAATGRLIRVADLYEGHQTLEQTITCNIDDLSLGAGYVSKVMDNGFKPVFKLTTALGRTIEATANHPFYTFDGWRNLSGLKVHDLIAVPRSLPVEGKKEWPDHDIIALAHLLAEDSGDFYRPALLVNCTKGVGILGNQSRQKEIPAPVFELNNRQIALLISRMWAGDGHINIKEHNVYYATSSERMASQLQHLLLRFGIISRLRVVDFPDTDRRIGYQLFVTGNDNLAAFSERILTQEDRSVLQVEYSKDNDAKSDIYWDRIVSIEYVGEKQTYDLEVPGTHNFIANDIVVHNSHAADYAVITVQTAYLKAHYPVEYLCALLEVEFDDTVKVPVLINECRRLGIDVLPPDINASGTKFTIEANPKNAHLAKNDYRRWAIRVGLGAIKNVGLMAVEQIIEQRSHGAFKTLDEFCERVDLRSLNRRIIECLGKVGSFDELVRPLVPDTPREVVTHKDVIDRMIGVSSSVHAAASIGQLSMFDLMTATMPKVTAASVLKPLPKIGKVDPKKRLDDEKELLGIYISEHPLQQVANQVGQNITHFCSDISQELIAQSVVIAGLLIDSPRVITTKKGEPMAFLKLEDLKGQMEVVVFPRPYEKARDLLLVDQILLVRGKVNLRNDSLSVLADQIQLYQAESILKPDRQAQGNGLHVNGSASTSAKTEEKPLVQESPSSMLEAVQYDITLTMERTENQQQDMKRMRRVMEALREYQGTHKVELQCLIPNGNLVEIYFPKLKITWNATLKDIIDSQNMQSHVKEIPPKKKQPSRQ